jgi:outer membrane protein assembly factor BamA
LHSLQNKLILNAQGEIHLIRIILFFFFVSINVTAQSDTLFYQGDYSIVIDSIEVTGNETTKDFVILRELTIGIGDTLNPKFASYDRERIYSLRIFIDVKLKPFSYEGKNTLLIEVEESWYIYPIPIIFLNDKDWDKISYGAALSWLNFRGRNERITGFVTFGYDPSFGFTYFNPNLAYNQNLNLQTNFAYSTVSNRSAEAEQLYGSEFDQETFVSRLQFGKRFGNYHWFYLNSGFDYIETPFYIEGINASNSRIDRTLIAGLSYVYDTRDLRMYATEGIYSDIGFEYKGFGIDGISYFVADLDFREYRKIFDTFTAKWRITARHTGGELVPYYDYSFIGYANRVRGYFYGDEQEGNDSFLGSIEFNYPIINETRIDLYFIPLLPRSLLSYRFSLVAELFADTGAARDVGSPWTIKSFDSGYGTGLSFLVLPYFTCRVEFAINDNAQTEWIFDLNASF